MTPRTIVATAGMVLVTVYAALMSIDALVLDPLAVVSGHSLPQIYTKLARHGMDTHFDVTSTLATSTVGVVLAAGIIITVIVGKLPTRVMAVALLAVLAGGAIATFGNGFALGMDVADTYGVSGGNHTPTAMALYGCSLAALLTIPVVILTTSHHPYRPQIPHQAS